MYERDDEDLVRFWDAVASGGHRPAWWMLTHPWRSLRAYQAVRRLPRVRMRVGPGPGGRAIRATLRRSALTRLGFWLFGAAVLEVPENPAAYLEGPRQATARRMVRRGVRAGLTCREVRPAERRDLLEMADRSEREHPDATYRSAVPENRDLLEHPLWRVCELDGEPLLLAVLPIDGTWSMLRYFRTLGHGEPHTLARWVATYDAVEVLSSLGVRHLLDSDHPAVQTAGVRHFQRMVGYRLVRLRAA